MCGPQGISTASVTYMVCDFAQKTKKVFAEKHIRYSEMQLSTLTSDLVVTFFGGGVGCLEN